MTAADELREPLMNFDGGIMKKFGLISLALIAALTICPTATLAQGNSKSKPAAKASAPARGNVNDITAQQLKDYLSFIASDEMEGRDTPSRGLDLTAKFLALNLSRWGLKPAGDGGAYFQRIALKRTKLEPAQMRAEVAGQRFTFGEDFLAQPAAEAVAGGAEGPLVYVGHGWMIKAKNIDAYQGVEVKDKIVIIASGLPKGVNFNDLRGKPGEDWESPQSYALKRGAKGIIAIPNPMYLSNWAQRRQALTERGPVSVEKFQRPGAAPLPAITASEKMVMALFQGEKQDGAAILKNAAAGDFGEAFELSAGKQASFAVGIKPDTVYTQNVVAVLEGSDPVLKNEYVAIGAHYDHVGNTPGSGCRPAGGDSLCNGADDDGSGTTAVLAIAEAFARGPRPKRSILFVWHAGEEKGLWGSKYITDYPPVPLTQIITQLNIDMIGRSKREGDTNPRNKELTGPHELYVIGSKIMSTELGELSERVNQSYLNLTFNYKYDDPKDPNRFFFRSDHFNYAQKGIPIIFYFDGEHEDYHRPSDHADKIDYQKMEKVTRTILATAWELANTQQRPRVDKQLPAEMTAN
jgi:Zn-dependent M28 family amino/carboxypeptidase